MKKRNRIQDAVAVWLALGCLTPTVALASQLTTGGAGIETSDVVEVDSSASGGAGFSAGAGGTENQYTIRGTGEAGDAVKVPDANFASRFRPRNE